MLKAKKEERDNASVKVGKGDRNWEYQPEGKPEKKHWWER